jgi:hypothetical protein
MQVIGRMEGGGLLALLSEADLEAIRDVRDCLADIVNRLSPASPPGAVSSTAAAEKSGAAGTPRPTKTGKAGRRKKAGAGFPCRVCGKPILGSRKGGRKVHPGCAKEWDKRYRRQHSDKPMVAPPINPSDPHLTDAQRKELAEQRRKLASSTD